ncbi:MAG: hypothetical protein M1827_006368 [Pycnora praestabilis]|nr:MAG: hypothetical protein M1827_006368 [Pycnora praestabilis]
MSWEVGTLLTTTKKTSKKHSERSERSNGNKRKRDKQQDPQSSPKKKHRSEKHKNDAEVNGAVATTDTSTSAAYSPFHVQTSSLYLPISPICQADPEKGLCAEHLSPLILTYYPPFRGVILSYDNVQLSETPYSHLNTANGSPTPALAKSIDEYAVSYIWVTAQFLLFKPQPGEWIEGWVNLQNEGHLGLVVLNLFNASIERQRLPKDWSWVATAKGKPSKRKENCNGDDSQELNTADEGNEGECFFEDRQGQKIEGHIRFRVKDIETWPSSEREKGFLSIEGTMLNAKDEKALLERDRRKLGKDISDHSRGVGEQWFGNSSRSRKPGKRASDTMDIDSGKAPKHRLNI